MLVVLPKPPAPLRSHLQACDFEAIARVIHELYAPDMVLEQFPTRVFELLNDLIPCEPPPATVTPPVEGEMRVLGLPGAEPLESKLNAFLSLHDSFAQHDFDPISSGGRTLLGGEWLVDDSVRDTTAFRESLRLLSVGDFRALPLRPGRIGGENVYLGFYRPAAKAGEFTERHRAILAELQPHLVRALDLAELRSAISGSLLSSSMLRSVLPITPRQSQILAWMAAGKTNAEISVIMDLKEGNVKLHVGALLQRLGAENRTTAALIALEALLKAQVNRASTPPRRGADR